jgi:hypothetical protein
MIPVRSLPVDIPGMHDGHASSNGIIASSESNLIAFIFVPGALLLCLGCSAEQR